MLISIFSYKKGFLLYLLLQMFWYPDVQLFNLGGLWINLNFVCALYFVFLYILKKNKVGQETIAFPFYRPMICIVISMLMTSLTSYSGPISELAKAFGLIVMDLVVVYIIWKIINTKNDFIFLFKGITLIVLFACIYCFYEKMTGCNPILDYKITCTANGFNTYRDFQQWDARGYRCYSIFDHTICACMVFSLYIAITLNLYVYKKNYPYKKMSLVTAILCVPAMFFTKQRAGMFMLFIAAISALNLRKRKFWKLIIIGAVALIVVFPLISDNLSLLLSIFSTKYENQVSGSSISMRFDQLEAVFEIMMAAPLTGLGENFQRYYTGALASRALGYESLWFEQMAKHGILGVLAYIVMIYYSVYKIPKKYKSKQVFFISLAYWVTYTLTSTPYFRTYFLYATIFYFIKNSEVYVDIKNRKEILRNERQSFEGYK